MQLAAGDTLGPYVVLEPAGSGGMGEVYKARDTRLNRVVALKVIGTSQVASPESRSQFAAEALAIAALNHPHICALYDTGHALARDFLVLEYLEGETLAHRLRRAPLQPPDVLRYAIEIAEALDYAHRHNIVHRDLKPANVLLSRSSGAKLLDFGLAGLRASAPSADGLSERATQPLDASPESTVLGTLQYMAPERFDGRPADARSDVFAFGAMFYEMVTRRTAFDEKNTARLMAAILSKEPPPIDAASGMPPEFQWIVQNCLAKEPTIAGTRWETWRRCSRASRAPRNSRFRARPEAAGSASGLALAPQRWP